MKTYILIPLVFTMLSLIACREDTSKEVMNQEPSPAVYVHNGILHVKNKDVLNELIKQNTKKSLEKLEEWEDSLGFKSYQSHYEEIFSKYESVIQSAKSIDALEEFKRTYKDEVAFPKETINGTPDYSIKPKINPTYMTVANKNGKLVVDGKKINVTNSQKATLKSTDPYKTCSKKTSDRKMNVTLYYGTNDQEYATLYVTHKKEIDLWVGSIWVGYKTRYYYKWNSSQPEPISTSELKSGSHIYLSDYQVTGYLEVWNRGVGDQNECTFTY